MPLIYKLLQPDVASPVDDTQDVQCSAESIDRQGEIIVQSGIEYASYLAKNPVVLWQHQKDMPIARVVAMWLNSTGLAAKVKWPPLGASAKSDEIRALVNAGVVNAISVGIRAIETIPIDPSNPKRGPQKFLRSELLEISFCSLPAQQDALVMRGGNDAAAARAKRLRDLEKMRFSPQEGVEAAARAKRVRELDLVRMRRC